MPRKKIFVARFKIVGKNFRDERLKIFSTLSPCPKFEKFFS